MQHVARLRQQMRRVDGQRRQRAEGQEIGLAVPRDDGEVVPGRRGDVGEIREVVAQVQRPDARVEDLLDGGDHVLAAERRAVVPDDAVAQMEGEGELVGRDFPTRGQRRLERVIGVLLRIQLRHRLDHLALQHPDDRQRGVGDAVQARWLLVDSHHQGSSLDGLALREARGQAAFSPLRVGVGRGGSGEAARRGGGQQDDG